MWLCERFSVRTEDCCAMGGPSLFKAALLRVNVGFLEQCLMLSFTNDSLLFTQYNAV